MAVDPGVSGGLAIRDAGGVITLWPMPDSVPGIVGILRTHKVADAELWIEEVPKFTGKNIPSSTTAVLFQNVGRIEGAAVALGYSLHRVTPKAWQEPLGLGGRRLHPQLGGARFRGRHGRSYQRGHRGAGLRARDGQARWFPQ